MEPTVGTSAAGVMLASCGNAWRACADGRARVPSRRTLVKIAGSAGACHRQLSADRLDTPFLAVRIDERHHHLSCRGAKVLWLVPPEQNTPKPCAVSRWPGEAPLSRVSALCPDWSESPLAGPSTEAGKLRRLPKDEPVDRQRKADGGDQRHEHQMDVMQAERCVYEGEGGV